MGATFVGIAAGVTSLTTKSRILVDLRLLDTRVAHVMMAGALISDTISLILFAGVLGALEAGALDLAGIAIVGFKVIAFFAVAFFLGLRIFPWLGRKLTEVGLTSRTFHFTFVLLLAVAFGELAHLAGLHAILGAFLAGLFLRDNVLGRSLSQDLMGAVRDSSIGFLAPIFFVTAGFEVSLQVFSEDLALLLSIIVVATLGKVVGTAAFYLLSGNGWREGLTIGGGMNGRGAVEIIVAGIALEMGLITREVFSILVFMAIFTTATVPFFLKWGTEWLRRRGELVRAEGRRTGLIILGAGPTARALAHALAPRETRLVDTNPASCRRAEAEGLAVTCGDALQEQVLAEAQASKATALLTLTPNLEVNALVARLARSVFLVPDVLLATDGTHPRGHATSMQHVGATTLFGTPVPLAEWDYWISHGATRERRSEIERDQTPAEWLETVDDGTHVLPMVVARGDERLPFHEDIQLRTGDEVIALERVEVGSAEQPDRFDRLAAVAPVVDLEGPLELRDFFARTAREIGRSMDVEPEEVERRLWEREEAGSTVLAPGLAIPHVLLPGQDKFGMMIARCRKGVSFPGQKDAVTTVFVLASSADERTEHLRSLSAITQIVNDPRFDVRWQMATGEAELREIVRTARRRRF